MVSHDVLLAKCCFVTCVCKCSVAYSIYCEYSYFSVLFAGDGDCRPAAHLSGVCICCCPGTPFVCCYGECASWLKWRVKSDSGI